jgi:hypothetical protein
MGRDHFGIAGLFQQIALGSKVIGELTFDLEKAMHGKRAQALDCSAPIFVTGMARAGTTALLRALYAQELVATLTFRDLPFLLAPNIWDRISARVRDDVKAQPRGQDDGILQSLDSPEALEEAFWRVFDGNLYIGKRSLRAYVPPIQTVNDYSMYVRLIMLRYGGQRYIAKNNNNVLRLSGLLHAFPDAVIVHPFRDPVQHVGSLMHHFDRAVKLHRKDSSKLSYMNYLAHHEFGLAHKPFSFPNTVLRGSDTKDPNYWLGHWIDLYSFLMAQPEQISRQQIFVDMDSVAQDAQIADALICGLIQTEPNAYPAFRKALQRDVKGLNPMMLRQAYNLAAEMRSRAVFKNTELQPRSLPAEDRIS